MPSHVSSPKICFSDRADWFCHRLAEACCRPSGRETHLLWSPRPAPTWDWETSSYSVTRIVSLHTAWSRKTARRRRGKCGPVEMPCRLGMDRSGLARSWGRFRLSCETEGVLSRRKICGVQNEY